MTAYPFIDLAADVTFRAVMAVKVWTPALGMGADGVWLSYPQVTIAGLAADALGPATITLQKVVARDRGLI